MNLLKTHWIHKLVSSRWFPMTPQVVMLMVFGLLIAGGIGVTTDDPGFAKWLRNTNLSNLVVWSYWWPLVIIAAILFGRVWCTVCPVELITYWAGRMGLRRKVPAFFKSGWVVTIFYTLILLVGTHTLAVHRIPHRMALYLLMLMVVAVAVALIFQKRAFCSYVCPVGHLLGLYALISPFKWRADDPAVCKDCKTKDCFVKKNHYRLIGRSCTSNLYPATIKDNWDCLLCTQCLKACPYDNIRFSTRRPFDDLFGVVDLRPAQVGFILVVSGFVVYEILSEWPVSKAILTWAPDRFVHALGMTGSVGNFVSATIMFVVFPVLMFLVVAALTRLASGWRAASSRPAVKTFALLLLPTMAGAHIIKSVLKMTSRIPYWRDALRDPKGVETAQRVVGATLVPDTSVPDAFDPAVSVAVTAVLLTALTATVLVVRRAATVRELDRGPRAVLLLAALAYWSIFAVTLLRWRFF